MIKINNVEFPNPSTYSYRPDIKFSSNAGETAGGVWTGDIIRKKHNFVLTWKIADNQTVQKLLNAVYSGQSFPVEIENLMQPSDYYSFTARPVQNDSITVLYATDSQTMFTGVTINIVER